MVEKSSTTHEGEVTLIMPFSQADRLLSILAEQVDRGYLGMPSGVKGHKSHLLLYMLHDLEAQFNEQRHKIAGKPNG